jgi:AcrR family transcriptional regulator
VTKRQAEAEKRPYELGKRLEQMDESRAAILRAAKRQLAAEEYRRLTMASLATESGVTRQTIHNLFGTRTAVLEAVFDVIALESGMAQMREVMVLPPGDAQLARFVGIFCGFWAKNRLLIRRVHGIGAIEPEFGGVIEARNWRRLAAATRIVQRMPGENGAQKAAMLAALTSFEFFDALAESCGSEDEAQAMVLRMARSAVFDKLPRGRTDDPVDPLTRDGV